MKKIILPDMTVEQRDSDQSHGILAPDLSSENLNKQLQEAIQMNHDVWKSDWEQTTLDILKHYTNDTITDEEIKSSVLAVTGFTSWKECVEFSQDDECTEFFNIARKFCGKEGQRHKRDKDFIDGSGIGYVKAYIKDVKVSLEKAFDAKYYFQVERPLVWALRQGIDLTYVANKIHPGHWSYPQGHMTKFKQAVLTLNDIYHLDSNCFKQLDICAYVLGQARCGSLIHYPMDAIASLQLFSNTATE